MQVIEESSNEIVYTLRINGTSYRPKVFKDGTYTIKVDEGDDRKVLAGVKSLDEGEAGTINVAFQQ